MLYLNFLWRTTLWVTDSIRIAHWSGMPNSLLNILPHHFHLKLSLLQEVFSIKNRFLTDWISYHGHITTICIKGEILSSFIQDKISPLIFSWKVSLNIFSFKNRFWIDWISFYGHRTTICIKGEILSLCSNRLIQYFWEILSLSITGRIFGHFTGRVHGLGCGLKGFLGLDFIITSKNLK